MGIHPTHLDSHMATLFSRPDLFAVYVKVAREYKLPFLAFLGPDTPPAIAALLSDQDILINAVVIANPSVPAGNWKDFYQNAIKNLKPGVTEIIVHLGHDDAELEAITVNHSDYGAAWRQRDYDVVTSPEFKHALEDNHVIPVHWKDLKKLLQ
jgi:chitin disaccharide deacetylase